MDKIKSPICDDWDKPFNPDPDNDGNSWQSTYVLNRVYCQFNQV